MPDSVPPQTVKPAGTSAAEAQAVQGVTGGVPIPVQGVAGATSDVTLHDATTTTQHLAINAAGQGATAPAVATAAAPTYVEGTQSPLSVDLAGGLRTSTAGGGLTDAQLRATPVPVSGPLTDTQLRASAVPVSGPLTDTQLRASAVPVSGPLTDTQLRATAVPVSGSVSLGAAIPAGTNNIGDVDVLTLPSIPAGTNNIGDVDVLTLPAIPAGSNNIGDVDVLSLPATPAGTNIVGAIRDVSGAMVDSAGNARSPAFAFANPSASGNTAVVAAQGTGIKIRVLAYTIVVSAAVSVKFQSATTDKTSLKAFAANGGISAPWNPQGHFETNANEALNVNLSGAVAVGVDVTWVPVA